MTALLRAEGISKSFGAVKAVDGVDLRVRPGEIVAVIGPNGAGKTTLFNALSGFAPADSGTVVLDGHDITRAPAHRIARLGLVRTFQAARPLRNATVLDNVLAGTYLHGRGGLWASLVPTPGVRRHENELLDRCRDTLAAGQLRLLEIARGLAAQPRALLLDEPAAGLNRVETEGLERILREIREAGTAVLLVEHDVDLVLRVSDHVTVLDFGRPLRQGSPEEVRHDPAVAAAYFGTKHLDAADAKQGGAK